MQLVDIMEQFILSSFLRNYSKKKPVPSKPPLSGGDFIIADKKPHSSSSSPPEIYDNKYVETTEKLLNEQEKLTENLFISLDENIEESKKELNYINSRVLIAEENLPDYLGTCTELKNLYREQTEQAAKEMLKLKNRNKKIDEEIKELEKRINSWQCIIQKAKQVQICDNDILE